ncbi:MAG TPA: MFS transporter [Candidatus Limnocylindrales bacterium]|nr:MFS transporter [Candidatus Limnocylindrales bacterium]
MAEHIASLSGYPSASMERSIWAVTIATFTLRFATGLTGALLVFLLADLSDHGGAAVGPVAVGVLTALFFAAELFLSPAFGVLADRVGHHRVMQVGPLFGFVAVLLTALAAEIKLPGSVVVAVPVLVGSLPLLGFTRLLEGASTAASVPSVLGFLAAVTSGDEALRGRASARFEAATIAGLGLGFAVAGPVWVVLGPIGFLANAGFYMVALGLYRYMVPASGDINPSRRRPIAWARYRRILGRPRIWLLAPTWIALNASLGLYTSQTLFQLVRTPDPRFAEQALVGGLEPLQVTLAFLLGGVVFFGGLWYWGGRFTALRRTTIIFYGIVGGAVFVVAALLLNHTGDVTLVLRATLLVGLGVGLFLIAGATPAALGLLADTSESFPRDRGAIMGLYSVFLALGQIIGAFVGALAAESWAFDGILLATLALLAIALLPLSHLRRYEIDVPVSTAGDAGLTGETGLGEALPETVPDVSLEGGGG